MRKNIIKIYRKDLWKIATNWVALVIMIGLSLLPSLYAWVNIWASWDPYSNTKGIKVGIVNDDKGGSFRGAPIDIGKSVSETLKKNDKLGWVFYDSSEDAMDAIEKGKVYAVIMIPEDFSKKMSTVLDENPEKPKLEYYVNQKMNAIAPKMTDSGASTLQKQISTTFNETAIQKAFEIFNKLGVELKDYYPKIEEYKYKLFELDENFPELSNKMDKLIGSAQNGYVDLDNKKQEVSDVQAILERTMNYMDDINKDLLEANDVVNTNSPKIKEDLALLQTILSNISNMTKEAGDSIVKNKPIIINDIDTALSDIQDIRNQLEKTANKIGDNGLVASAKIKNLYSEISDSLTEYEGMLVKLRFNIINVNSDVQPILSNLVTINNNLVTQIDTLITELNKMFDSMDSALNSLQTITKNIGDTLSAVQLPSSDQINQQIDGLVVQLKQLNTQLGGNPLFANVVLMNEQLINMLEQLKTYSGNIDKLQELVKQIADENYKLSQEVANTRNSLKIIRVDINSSLTLIQDTCRKISKLCSDLQVIFSTSTSDIVKKIDSTLARMNRLDASLKDTTDKLSTSVADDSTDIKYRLLSLLPKLDELSKRLINLKELLQNHNDVETLLFDISELTFNLQAGTQQILVRMDENILPKIEKYLKNSASFVLDIRNVVNNTNSDLEVFKDFLDRIKEKEKITVEELTEIKGRLPKVQDDVHNITTKIKDFEATENVQDLEKILSRDASKEGDFFSAPVELNTHKVFKVDNYGAAMTPFYSTLSLWVGALLLTALLSTKAKNVDFDFTPKEEFFGKYLLFVTFGIFQGFVVSLGDLIVLGVKPQEPVLFVLLGIFYSIVFVMIIYSLVALFGNVGKAIAVVFMVVQLAGSGGTFPIEILPKAFQMVYSVLPFTYAINAMREAIGGVVYHNLIQDVSILLCYLLGFMIFGLKSKKWVNMISDKLAHKLGESGIVGH